MKNIIWDMDGVLYPFNDAYYQNDFSTEAKIMTRRKLCDWDTAMKMSAESQKLYGGSYEIFMLKFGLDFDDLDREFTDTFAASGFLKPNPELVNAFQNNPLQNILYSHGPRRFIGQVLENCGLSQFFPPELIFSKYDFQTGDKARYADGFLKIIELVGIKSAETYMVENEEPNLRIPADMGMTPVMIDTPSEFRTAPTSEFNGQVFTSSAAFLKSISR